MGEASGETGLRIVGLDFRYAITPGVTEADFARRIKIYRGGEEKSYDLHKPEHAALRLWPHDIIEVPAKLWTRR